MPCVRTGSKHPRDERRDFLRDSNDAREDVRNGRQDVRNGDTDVRDGLQDVRNGRRDFHARREDLHAGCNDFHAGREDVHASREDDLTRVTYFVTGVTEDVTVRVDLVASCVANVTPERSDRPIDGSDATAVARNDAAGSSRMAGDRDDVAPITSLVTVGYDRRPGVTKVLLGFTSIHAPADRLVERVVSILDGELSLSTLVQRLASMGRSRSKGAMSRSPCLVPHVSFSMVCGRA